MGYAQKRMTS